jgi:hypothetical protein
MEYLRLCLVPYRTLARPMEVAAAFGVDGACSYALVMAIITYNGLS